MPSSISSYFPAFPKSNLFTKLWLRAPLAAACAAASRSFLFAARISSFAAERASWIAVRAELRSCTDRIASVREAARALCAHSKGVALVRDIGGRTQPRQRGVKGEGGRCLGGFELWAEHGIFGGDAWKREAGSEQFFPLTRPDSPQAKKTFPGSRFFGIGGSSPCVRRRRSACGRRKSASSVRAAFTSHLHPSMPATPPIPPTVAYAAMCWRTLSQHPLHNRNCDGWCIIFKEHAQIPLVVPSLIIVTLQHSPLSTLCVALISVVGLLQSLVRPPSHTYNNFS